MLLNIRATNGGGKSTVVRGLLDIAENKQPIYGVLGPRIPEGYELRIKGVKKSVYVLGGYELPTGGCDLIQPYDLILELLRKYAPKGHVVFEGVLVSSSYGRVGLLMEEWGQEAVMAFLDTPLETCIKNVEVRRKARGDERPFNPANLTSKYNQILKNRERIAANGKLRVVLLNYGRGLEQALDLLRGAP